MALIPLHKSCIYCESGLRKDAEPLTVSYRGVSATALLCSQCVKDARDYRIAADVIRRIVSEQEKLDEALLERPNAFLGDAY